MFDRVILLLLLAIKMLMKAVGDNELPRSRADEVSRNGKELLTPMQSIEEFLD